MSALRFGSCCSGIEAASVAFSPLGWEAAWFSEIEAFPRKVLAHHYPAVPNHGDMTTLPARIASGEVEAPDVLCGGTPCQAFSVAGLRNSLSDARGNLSMTFCEIANAIDTKRREAGKPPSIVFWENVPGALNTVDNFFGCFLGALVGEDVPLEPAGGRWSNAGCVYGPERAISWRVLDAQHFGLAQRRKRLFVVACSLDVAHPTQILFECESGIGNPEQGLEHGTPEDTGPAEVRAFDMLGFGQYGDGKTSSTLKARDYKDATDLVVTFVKGTNPHSAEEAPTWRQTDTAACLNGWDARHNPPKHLASDGLTVRRLMPLEYERLMGFPDNYTDIPGASDTARYKALGNSWPVPVVSWIGSRIQGALK